LRGEILSFDQPKRVNSFFLRHHYDLSEIKSTRQEERRLEVPRAFLDETMRGLRKYVDGIKAQLVFNLGEVSVSEWEDENPKKVIIPKTIAGKTAHHRAS
jgi:hypothetical protein